MPDAQTDHYDLTKPEDGASEDDWGVKVNGNFDLIDELLYQLLTSACYAANTGTADALVVTLDPAPEALIEGQRVFVKVAAPNTAAVTLKVGDLAAKNVVLSDGSALTAGVLKAGGTYAMAYDGARFQVVGEVARASSADALTGTNASKAVTPKALGDLNTKTGGVYVLKLPGGFMIQGGSYAGGSANPSVDFPVDFSETPVVNITAVGVGSDTNGGSNSVRQATLATKSAGSFTAYCSMESEVSDVFVSSTNTSFDWVAIGKVAT